MKTREVLRSVEYKTGLLSPLSGGGEPASRLPIQVIRLDQGRLLVRFDDPTDLVRPNLVVELLIGTTRALFRLLGAVERIVNQELSKVAYVLVDDVQVIQRRKQRRFKVNYFSRFVPVCKDKKGNVVEPRAYGIGRITDLSLEGMRFETEYALPVGMLGHFLIRIPTGELDLYGRIVRMDRGDSKNMYGVKITSMDRTSEQRLNRLIISFEQRDRQEMKRAESTVTLRRSINRSRPLLLERWEGRERRRGRQ